MDIFQAIEDRYSYRGPFKPTLVPEADLRRIVQAGLLAPSGKNLQTTEFVVANETEKVARIREVLGGRPYIDTAPAFIATLFAADQAQLASDSFYFEVEDNAAATQNLLLAITALGYASVWLDGVLRREQRAERIGAILGLPPTKRIRVLLPVGVPTGSGPRKDKRGFGERAWFNRYGG
jgi:nitroreductase